MTTEFQIDFSQIRPLDGDQRKGFEEFVCQIARQELPEGQSEFRRVEGSGGDGGVEAYWLLSDHSERGYQAKYFLSTKDIDWAQVDRSVKTAIEQHPKLTQYTIALACDLTDQSGKLQQGNTGWKRWATHKKKWEEWSRQNGLSIEFVPWTKSDIMHKLTSSTLNRGLILYWFNEHLFDISWFRAAFERTKADLGERFHPEDHVDVWLAKAFDGLARTTAYRDWLASWFSGIPNTGDLISSVSKLEPAPNSTLLKKLQVECALLRDQGKTVSNIGIEPLPIPMWVATLRSAMETLFELHGALHQTDSAHQGQKETLRLARKHLGQISAYLDTRTPVHLGANNPNELRVEADLRRLLLVVGEAGCGKSHLFADVVASKLGRGVPALLLLGQHFPGNNLRQEFLGSLDLTNHEFEKVLQALNAAGQLSGQRLVILIDALNETQALRAWPDQLAGFVADILRYDWLAIAVSLRPEYEQLLIPPALRNTVARATCYGIQSPEEQEQAAVQYFEKRKINRPAVPWLAPEFSNFLFLKTCCDSLAELGETEFPRGLRGSLQVLSFYLRSVDLRLRRRFPESDLLVSAVASSVRTIAEKMAAAREDFIEQGTGIRICQEKFGSVGPSPERTWFSLLASEGVLRKDHIFDPDQDPLVTAREVYRFTYQRFSDHLIAEALLRNVDDIANTFVGNGSLSFLAEKRQLRNRASLFGALAIQIPEKFPNQELLDVFPTTDVGFAENHVLSHAFTESLLWRSTSAFSDRTLHFFNELPEEDDDSRFSILIRLSTIRGHPWNAEFLDKNLKNRAMPERDAFWTTEVNKIFHDDRHPTWELIGWCLKADIGPADTETLRLAAITLCWTFTSSCSPLRDKATKSLISVFCTRPQIVPEIIRRFGGVDDLYVMERICAAALGAIVRLTEREHITAIASATHEVIFSRETPHVNINLRDYARATIEFAACRIDRGIDISKSRPPHRSDWPLPIPSKEEIEQAAEQHGGKQILLSASGMADFARYEIEPAVYHFTPIPLSEPRPLNDSEREQEFLTQIGGWAPQCQSAFSALRTAINERQASLTVTTGDLESLIITMKYSEDSSGRAKEAEEKFLSCISPIQRDLYERLMLPVIFPERVSRGHRELPQFNAEAAKRWIVKRSYEYGWTIERFPNDQSHDYSGRERPKVERIGKKYQWLALNELLARLADNVWTIDRWSSQARAYDHPARDWFVRDVEPSLLADPKSIQEAGRGWWQTVSLELDHVADDQLREWPFSGMLPYTAAWIDVTMPDAARGLLLYGVFSARQNREGTNIGTHAFKRDIFVRVSTILVDTNQAESAIAKLRGTRLADPTGHEAIDWPDGPFLCEYPWRNTWRPDHEPFEEDNHGKFSGIRLIRPVARYVWETPLDSSLKEGARVHIPNPWIGRELGLRPDLDRIGIFVAGEFGSSIFLDPTVEVAGSAAIIRSDIFFDFLKRHGLECLWITAGERNAWPSGHHGDYSCRSFAAIHRWKDSRWESFHWHEDSRGSHS